MDKLTDRQLEAFQYIRHHTETHGFAPSLREICEHMGYRAVGSAQDVIASLRRKGYLQTHEQQKARSLSLTKQAKMQYEGKSSWSPMLDEDTVAVPKIGSVPAGKPVEAISYDTDETLKVSLSLLPRPTPKTENLFALQARGLSMVNAGILDGDWLIVKSQNEAPPWSIVVALVNEEATVKRLGRDPEKGWCLIPENPTFSKIYASDSPFKIIGRVIALQRSIL